MALPGSSSGLLLSPTRQRGFGAAAGGVSPARLAALPSCCAPAHAAAAPAPAARRRLPVLQQSGGAFATACGVGAPPGGGRDAPPSALAGFTHAGKRFESAAAAAARGARAPAAACQQLPPPGSGPPSGAAGGGHGRQQQQQQWGAPAPAAAGAAAASAGAASAPAAQPQLALLRAASVDAACGVEQLQQQLPSPLAILEFPPELEARGPPPPPPQQQQQQPQQQPGAAAAGDAAALPAAAAADARVLPGQHGAAHAPHAPPACGAPRHAHSMSGQRLALRYDVPLGLDWLVAAPDHVPALGDGRLEVIVGPMFAGKSTALIQRIKELSSAGKLHAAVKSSKDSRYSSHWVVTHDGRCTRCYTADSLAEFKATLGPAWHKLQVLAIDEAQFFPDLVEFCADAVDGHGKHVIVAGLSGDFRRQRFGQVLDLLPLADRVTQLTSVCGFCGNDALFSLRLVSGGPQALVGGEESYRPTCRRCYLARSSASANQ